MATDFNVLRSQQMPDAQGYLEKRAVNAQNIRANNTAESLNQQKITQAKLTNLHSIAQTVQTPEDVDRAIKMVSGFAPEIANEFAKIPPEQRFSAIQNYAKSSLEDQLKAFDLKYKMQQMDMAQQDQAMQVEDFNKKGKFIPLNGQETSNFNGGQGNNTNADGSFGEFGSSDSLAESNFNEPVNKESSTSIYDKATPGTKDGQPMMQLPDGRELSQAQFDKERGNAEKADRYVTSTIKKADTIIPMINDVIAELQNSDTATGFPGQIAGYIGGTSAARIEGMLDGIKSNLGFDNLAEMRQNSPTGGALGQVSEKENTLLQSTKGTLERKSGKDELIKSLERIRDNYIGIAGELGGDTNKYNASSINKPLIKVTTQKQFDKLPSGSLYIEEDGKTYRKP